MKNSTNGHGSRDGSGLRRPAAGFPRWRSVAMGIAAAGLVSTAAHGQNLFWDANAGAAGTGGSGTWDLSSSLWRLDSTVGALQTYTNTAGGMTANFGGSTGTVTIASGVTVNANVINVSTLGYNIAGADATAALNMDGITPTINFSAGGNDRVLTVSANITGTSGLNITRGGLGTNNRGTIVLSGSNSYSGGTTINFGVNQVTLELGSNSALGTGAAVLTSTNAYVIRASGSAARILSNNIELTTNNNITFGDAGNSGDLTIGNLTKSAGSGNTTMTVNNRTRVANFSSSAGTLTKSGTGSLIVDGNFSHGGAIALSGGAIAVAGSYSAATATLSGGGQLGRNGALTVLNNTDGVRWGSNTSGGLFAYGSNSTWGDAANNLTVNFGNSPTPSTVTWNGTGTTFVSTGQTLILGNSLSNGAVNLQNQINLNGATQTVQVIKGETNASGGADAVLSGTLSNGGLTKTGDGTLLLTAQNTYAGPTTVNEGTLIIDTSASLASAVTVNAGMLGGSGSSSGNVTIGDGAGGSDAFLAPGSSPGTFTTTGSLSLNSDATYRFELNSSNLTADKVVANGISLDNASQFSFTDLGSSTLAIGLTFTIIDNTSLSSIIGQFSNLADGQSFVSGANSFEANYQGGTGNDLVLTVVVPEPSGSGLILLGIGIFLNLQRRRRRVRTGIAHLA